MTQDGLHAFAFQTGRWSVRHRKLKRRLVGETAWIDFTGECSAWELLDGAANIDEHVLDDPSGPYKAATLRWLEPTSGLWSIRWVDGRDGVLQPPVHGRFEDGVGRFYGDDTLEGRPIVVRFIWSQISPGSARWEQAFSPDGGAAWETNWTMLFQKVA